MNHSKLSNIMEPIMNYKEQIILFKMSESSTLNNLTGN